MAETLAARGIHTAAELTRKLLVETGVALTFTYPLSIQNGELHPPVIL